MRGLRDFDALELKLALIGLRRLALHIETRARPFLDSDLLVPN